MAKNKKRRSGSQTRRLRPVEALFMAQSIFTPKAKRAQPFPKDEIERQHTVLVAILDDLRTGSVTTPHAESIQAQINETLKFFEADVLGPNDIEESHEHLQVCVAAREALLGAVVRADGSSTLIATEEEMRCLLTFAHLRVELMRSEFYTIGASLAAQREVLNCFRRGHFDHVRSPDLSPQGGADHA